MVCVLLPWPSGASPAWSVFYPPLARTLTNITNLCRCWTLSRIKSPIISENNRRVHYIYWLCAALIFVPLRSPQRIYSFLFLFLLISPRILFLVSRFSFLVSRFSFLVTPLPPHPLSFCVFRFCFLLFIFLFPPLFLIRFLINNDILSLIDPPDQFN